MQPSRTFTNPPDVRIDEVGGVPFTGNLMNIPVTGESRLLVKVSILANMPQGGMVMAKFYDTAQGGTPVIRDGTYLFRNGASDQYWGWVPLARLHLSSPSAANNYLYAGVHTILDGSEQPMSSQQAMVKAYLDTSRQVTVSVDARNSLWFAYAPPRFAAPSSGPMGEAEMADAALFTGKSVYRPVMLLVPETTASPMRATVRYVSSNTWRHGDPANAAYASGPGGTTWQSALASAHAAYYLGLAAGKIADVAFGHNRLLYMLDNGGNGPFTPVAFPAISSVIDCSSQRRMYLAMHDSWEWNNNQGTQAVIVEWGT